MKESSYPAASFLREAPSIHPHSSSQRIEEGDIEEVVPVKTEPRESGQGGVVTMGNDYTDSETHVLAPVEEDSYGYRDDQYVDYEQSYGDINQARQINYAETSVNKGTNDRLSLMQYITQNSVGASASFQCTLCGKINGQKNNIMNHVESIHFPGSFTYHCQLCDKTVQTKSALNLHNARYHSKKR